MDSKIKRILEKMEALNIALKKEHARLAKKYGFYFSQKKIVFLKKIKIKNKRFRIPVWKYVIPKNIRHAMSLPFIYMMIVPAVILDIFLTIYHAVAFPLYKIPKVRRSEYIIYDRKFLDYLNVVQKVHCLYCSYINGLFAYAVEIAARTERYWCPIKAASKMNAPHSWYKDFADYGNPQEWNQKFNNHEAFECMKGEDKK
ncbi:MAG: hypothetical protein UR66_C0006G0030 [Candidatus Moranbacteria bacterium GW2011_GWE1_35_17]|nr:MAG: hypothetical protein UR66_C0006G0030 [Candidatus Moranbacteria bacterium GW2011_GWE1_35_17]